MVYPSTINVGEAYRPSEIVEKGPVTRSLVRNAADTYSDTNWVFQNIVPPSTDICMDRVLKLKGSIYMWCTVPNWEPATAAVPPLPRNAWDTDGSLTGLTNTVDGVIKGPVGHAMCLRSFPFQQCMNALDVKINGAATNVSPIDTICTQADILDPKMFRFAQCSGTPIGQDRGAFFSQGLSESLAYNNGLAQKFSTSYQGARQDFIPYICYLETNQTVASSVDIVLRWDIVEQMAIAPFRIGDIYYDTGLSRVQNITVNINFGPLYKAICSAVDLTLSNVGTGITAGNFTQPPQVSFVGGMTATFPGGNSFVLPTKVPELITTYSMPDPITVAKMPPYLTYEYYQIQNFIKRAIVGSTAQIAVPQSIASDTIRLPSIPQLIYVYIRPSKSLWQTVTGIQYTDHYLNITNLNVTFMDRVGLLSTFGPVEIYEMSVKNGLKMSYPDWLLHGSLVIINVAEDLCLDVRAAPGQSMYANFQVQVQYSANDVYTGSGTAYNGVPYDLYITTAVPGKCIVGGGQCSFTVEGASQSKVLALLGDDSKKSDVREMEPHTSGGGFGSFLKRHVPKLLNLAAKHSDLIGGLASSGISALSKRFGGGDGHQASVAVAPAAQASAPAAQPSRRSAGGAMYGGDVSAGRFRR
jgi:hypothetical protein